MNKFIFFIIFAIITGAISIGTLGVQFDFIAQQLGIFHTDDVILDGCECFSSAGMPMDCPDEVTSDPLCQTPPP